MSGQPYRYYTDPVKYRTMFMETLDLQANINAMNLEANKTYKETGQLPAVSQMRDTRTTSEILADAVKIKTDLIKAIEKVSSQQFGQQVVQRIESHPLNIDNKLLIFTAQRIDDIVFNLKKIYKYGISGDSNDVEQLVKFIVKMYNDKNSITAQTKSFMDSQGIRTMGQSANSFAQLSMFLTRLDAKVISMNADLKDVEYVARTIDLEGSYLTFSTPFSTQSANAVALTGEIASLIKAYIDVIPKGQEEATIIEATVLKFSENVDETFRATETEPGQLTAKEAFAFGDEGDIYDDLKVYLDFLTNSLPSIALLTSIEIQVDTYFRQVMTSFNNAILPAMSSNNLKEYVKGIAKSGLDKAFKINLEKLNDVLTRMYSILLGDEEKEMTEYKIRELKARLINIRQFYKRSVATKPVASRTSSTVSSLAPKKESSSSSVLTDSTEASNPSISGEKTSDELNEIADELNEFYNKSDTDFFDTDRIDEIFIQLDNEFGKNFSLREGSDRNDYLINIESAINFLNDEAREARARGDGLKGKVPKRRGRPKGSGIGKTKTYKEIVKANSSSDKGIFETPRFVKFGKYLINTHRLNNEDIFALKRPSGGNIVEIPSQKLSKNLSSVIKKMLGGELPTYSDISKLSEPEKAYLHKISKKSNILDKFDIPAPSKDAFEKDIHQFEVMKGEILAGNDNKELIRKFKAHILKLSKSGALPKREVHEILEDLLELNC